MLNSEDLINKVKIYNKFLNPERLNKAYNFAVKGLVWPLSTSLCFSSMNFSNILWIVIVDLLERGGSDTTFT